MDPYLSLFPVAFLAAYMVIYVVILAIMIISMWKIYEKMGEPGWKGIIPYYNIWVMIERLKKPKSWFWILLATSVVMIGAAFLVTLFSVVAAQAGSESMYALVGLFSIFMLALCVVVLVYQIKLYHALSKSFGHDAGFTVGIILLPVVFFPILAFGDSQFIAPVDEPKALPVQEADEIPAQPAEEPIETPGEEAVPEGEKNEI